jgi:hypothetical protein
MAAREGRENFLRALEKPRDLSVDNQDLAGGALSTDLPGARVRPARRSRSVVNFLRLEGQRRDEIQDRASRG